MKNLFKFSFTLFLILSFFSISQAQTHKMTIIRTESGIVHCFQLCIDNTQTGDREYSENIVCYDQEGCSYEDNAEFQVGLQGYTCVVTIEGLTPNNYNCGPQIEF